jgi:hypothetical protein
MHDAKGQELKLGDKVILPCRITNLGGGPDYCNVTIESLATMPPNHDSHVSIGAVNTTQVIRANKGDDTSFVVVVDGRADKLCDPNHK